MGDPLHRAVIREAQLAAAQIANGVTALGKANHAETGLYAQAFFGLSIGLERMGKLVFLADHAIKHGGAFPTDQDLRTIGHNISSLLPACESIGKFLDPARTYAARPSDAIHKGIEETLSAFATKLRYYNLNHLAGAAGGQDDPIAMWWEKVATPICTKHYPKHKRDQDEAEAAVMEQMVGHMSAVVHTAEDGSDIRTVASFFSRAGATNTTQKYGRLYTLQIVRWLGSILFELSHRGAYELRIKPLLGMQEPFTMFLNEDRYLRDRRSWAVCR